MMFAAFLPFILKHWRIVAIIAAAVAVFFILRHIHGKIYQSGFSACENVQLVDHIEASEMGRKEKSANDKKYKIMPTTDIDRVGVQRGWVRPLSER